MHRWYVVHTQPRAEDRALWHLGNQGFECFLPRVRKITRHARRARAVLEPLFPRYLFTRLDLNAAAWRSINGTRGVVSMLTQGPQPAPVPEGIVEKLQAETGGDGVTSLAALGLLWKGREVRVKSGPFSDQTARVAEVLPNSKDRVQILLTMLGAPVRLHLPSYAIQAS